MLDLIAPRAQSAWPRSEKVMGRRRPGLGQGSVTASVLPEDLRVETSRGHSESAGRVQERDALATKMQGQDALATTQGTSPGREVLTPIEFGDSTPREPPPAETKPKERTEWVFRNGKYVQVVVTEDGSRLPKAVEPSSKPAAGPAGPGTGGDWTLRDGQWVRTQDGELPTANPATAGTAKPAGNEGMTLQTRSPAAGRSESECGTTARGTREAPDGAGVGAGYGDPRDPDSHRQAAGGRSAVQHHHQAGRHDSRAG